jgi:hypothetical protein
MKHLRDANMGYWQHWLHATKIGLSLLIHAWFPGLLTTYASDHLCNKPKKIPIGKTMIGITGGESTGYRYYL